MINSRSLNDLVPLVGTMAQKLIDECKKHEIDIIITSTYRDIEAQNKLYAQGRTAKGAIVTNAKGGESFHQYRVAFDVVPIVNGKCVWSNSALWNQIGAIGESAGLEWAGKWRKFKEMPHFQYTQGYSVADFKNGAVITDKA